MIYSDTLNVIMESVAMYADRHEIVVTPELVFLCMVTNQDVQRVVSNYEVDLKSLVNDLSITVQESEEKGNAAIYDYRLQSLMFEVEKFVNNKDTSNGEEENVCLISDIFKQATTEYPEIYEYFEENGFNMNKLGEFFNELDDMENEVDKKDIQFPFGVAVGHDNLGNSVLLFGNNIPFLQGNQIQQKTKDKSESDDEDNKVWSSFCKNLCKEVLKHPEPLVGRESEMNQTLRILCRKEKSNVMHLGEAGVGKTAMTLGLARKLNEDDVPEKLKGHKLYSLNMGSLVAGTHYRGDLEERVRVLIEDLDNMGNAILYIDEIHMIVGNGSESMDVGNLLKQALLNTSIKFIGSTTNEEYRKYLEKDKALSRRFKIVELVEPTHEETKEIIKGIISYYEDFHNVEYTDSAIESSIELSSKYINDKFLPDKAIDLIDESGAEVSKNRVDDDEKRIVIDKVEIEDIISESYHIPKETVQTTEGQKILELEDKVKEKVFGQEDAIKSCIDTIKLSRVGLTEPNKPIASLLFVGQTGVGKTEIAKQIANVMGVKLIRFDMSEYMDKTSVNKLIGSSAGYVGYEEGGILVEKIRHNPHCVLLLDEIEKAHPLVFNALLQVMDNATLTDNKGRVADFKNVLIIMTSNAGASSITKKGLGFGSQETIIDLSEMDKAVEQTFTPEFRNRLTKVIKLNAMTDEMADKIVTKYLNQFKDTMKLKGIDVTYTDKVHEFIKNKGITKEFGARPIIKAVDEHIKMLFVDKLLTGELKEGSSCRIGMSKKGDKSLVIL